MKNYTLSTEKTATLKKILFLCVIRLGRDDVPTVVRDIMAADL